MERVTALVDRVVGRDEFDFVMDLAADLPVATLAEVMGVPEEEPLPPLRLVESGHRLSGR